MARKPTKDDIEFERKFNYTKPYKHKCPLCGYKVLISPKVGKSICRYCGVYVYSDKNLEFKDKMKRMMKK